MRGQLATVIRARVERLVDDLVERIAEQVEQQLDDALEAARSALESDLVVRDTIEMPLVGPVGRVVHRDVKPANVSSDDVSSRRAEPGEASARRLPAPRDRAPSSDTSPVRRPKSCSKCGAVGFTAAGCGRTHNVPSTPASETAAYRGRGAGGVTPASAELDDDQDDDADDGSEKTESPPHVTRADRFAAIEASARKRAGDLPVPRTSFDL